VLVAGAELLVGLVFAAFTQHAWEDYWITFRVSRNLATGHGLVFTPGERLHSFTSPLGGGGSPGGGVLLGDGQSIGQLGSVAVSAGEPRGAGRRGGPAIPGSSDFATAAGCR